MMDFVGLMTEAAKVECTETPRPSFLLKSQRSMKFCADIYQYVQRAQEI